MHRIGLLALALSLPAAARAAGDEELTVTAGLGWAKIHADGRTPGGATLGVDVAYGLDDAWSLRATVGVSSHGVEQDDERALPGGAVEAATGGVGVTYALDVLRFVPYAEIGLAALLVGGDVTHRSSTLGVQAGVGGDYYLTRRWLCGAVARYLFTPADLAVFPPDLGRTEFFFSFSLRLARVF